MFPIKICIVLLIVVRIGSRKRTVINRDEALKLVATNNTVNLLFPLLEVFIIKLDGDKM